MAFAHNGPVEIFYETFGDPGDPTLVLINGLGSQCINYRTEWCERFAARGLHVVRLDNRDVGLSTHFSEIAPDVAGVVAALGAGRPAAVPYTLSDMAADVVAVLDALGVDRAHVMGLSMGGMIVQTLAIEHAERLCSITSVMSTTGEPDVGQASPAAQARLLGAPATDRASAIANHLAGLRIWGSPGRVDEAAQARYSGEAFDRAFDPPGVARQLTGVMASGSRAEALRRVTVSTLVMHGSADVLIDPSGGRRTADLVPGARFVLLEGMGHDYPEAYWDQWVDLVATHAAQADAALEGAP
ncbi:MAG TPA: alpha/beta hydrolase [Acidimicrobiales bacterium]|nr:alpha/beta hydrolase [Acidimicrobiales bacterium]